MSAENKHITLERLKTFLDNLKLRFFGPINERLDANEQAIADEATAREEAVTAEQTRAEGAESDLQDVIDAETSNRESEIARVEGLVSAETTRATEKEGELSTTISDEQTRAEGVESDLQDAIDAEAAERGNEITRVEGLISAEETRATNAESALQGAIDATNTNLSTNYYTKSETYNQEEINSMIKAHMSLEVVSELPDLADASTTKIYLLPLEDEVTKELNTYEEYICVETSEGRHWEMIGTAEVDLSNYVQFDNVSSTLTDGTVLFTIESDASHKKTVYIQPTAPQADVEKAFTDVFGA